LDSIPWDDEALLRQRSAEVIHLLPDRQVISVSYDAPGDLVYCKRYVSTSLRAKLSAFFRGSRARREFNAYQQAIDLGLPTARPVALLERRSGLFVTESVIATEKLSGQRLDLSWQQCSSDAQRRELTRASGAFLCRVHQAGLRHGDMTCKNLFVNKTADGWELSIFDLPSATFARSVSWRSRAKDLYQLIKTLQRRGLGVGGRLRLLKSYAGAAEPSDQVVLRRLWRGVGHFLRRRQRKEAKRQT
jgi:tRNA A-37 threonylcarbamoyl transferase component Bud32